MLFGAIFLEAGKPESDFEADMSEFRDRHDFHHEFKWGKVSRSYLPHYKEFVDIFFDHENVQFRCFAVEECKIDYSYHKDDENINHAENAFYAFYRLFLSRNMTIGDTHQVVVDKRNDLKKKSGDQSGRLCQMKDLINLWAEVERSSGKPLVSHVEARDSKKSDTIQMNDLLLGAVGYDLTGYRNVSGAAPHKGDFCHYLESKLGCDSLKDFRVRTPDFNLWVFDFDKVKPKL